jgi:large subunit ribosomal protein L32e
MTDDLLKQKNLKKSKNPKFVQSSHHKKIKRLDAWRHPRGRDNKTGLRMQGRPVVHPGYGTPAELRGSDRTGKFVVLVSNKEKLKELDPKKHTIIVSRRLGFLKKKALLEEIKKSKFSIHNIKNPDEYVKNKTEILDSRRKVKAEKTKKEEKEVKKKESIEDKLSEEEKKKLEKQEIDRLLTKKF